MAGESAANRPVLGIADGPSGPLFNDPFVATFVTLGSLLRKQTSSLAGRQLVVAVSVPCRDFVAALIGAGWMVSAPTPKLQEPMEVFRAAEANKKLGQGSYLRAVTARNVIAGAFARLDKSKNPPRVTIGNTTREVTWYRAACQILEACWNIETAIPDPGFLGELCGAAKTWLERIADPARDLALVGTLTWLMDDLTACIGNFTGLDGKCTQLANYVLPAGPLSATWATSIVPAVRLGEGNALPAECVLAVLDRYGAVKYLNEVETSIVVCVIDRSVADESASELVIQARVANSQPVSLRNDLRWSPPPGVEALAFTVAL